MSILKFFIVVFICSICLPFVSAETNIEETCRFLPLDEMHQKHYISALNENADLYHPGQSKLISKDGKNSLLLMKDDTRVRVEYNNVEVLSKLYDATGNFPFGKLFISNNENNYFTWIEAYGEVYYVLNGNIFTLPEGQYISFFYFLPESGAYYYIRREGDTAILVSSKGDHYSHSNIEQVEYSEDGVEMTYLAFDIGEGYSLIKNGEEILKFGEGEKLDSTSLYFSYIPDTKEIAYLKYINDEELFGNIEEGSSGIVMAQGLVEMTGELVYSGNTIQGVESYVFSSDGKQIAYKQRIGDDYYITTSGGRKGGYEAINELEYLERGGVFSYTSYKNGDKYISFGEEEYHVEDMGVGRSILNDSILYHARGLSSDPYYIYSCNQDEIYGLLYNISQKQLDKKTISHIDDVVNNFGKDKAVQILSRINSLPKEVRLGGTYISFLDYLASSIWMQYMKDGM